MEYKVKLYSDGRIILPAELRQRWGLQPGQELLLQEEDGHAHLTTLNQSIEDLKKEIKADLPDGISLVDQLEKERRLAARQE